MKGAVKCIWVIKCNFWCDTDDDDDDDDDDNNSYKSTRMTD